MPFREALGELDNRIMRRRPGDRLVAPPAWVPDDGQLKPVMLQPSQLVALWTSSGVVVVGGLAAIVARLGSRLGYTGADVVTGLISPVILVAISYASASRRRGRNRPPRSALRWVPPATPVVAPRFLSGWLIAALMMAVIEALEIACGLPLNAAAFTIVYVLLIPLNERQVRMHWKSVETSNVGRVVRLAGRGRRKRGTSGLYFVPLAPARDIPSMAHAGTPDRSNAYRAPSR